MNHMLRRQSIAGGNARLARRQRSEFSSRLRELRSGGAMNRPIHSAAALQRRIGRIDDRIGIQLRDVAAKKLDRVLTNDPGTGVMRHADAGYARAVEVARERGVRIPMLKD